MLMRIFSKHPLVHTLNEPHFFERYWDGPDKESRLSVEQSALLLLKMTSSQRDGFFAKPNTDYHQECLNAVLAQDPRGLSPSEVYQLFMLRETQLHQRVIPCDKTPKCFLYTRCTKTVSRCHNYQYGKRSSLRSCFPEKQMEAAWVGQFFYAKKRSSASTSQLSPHYYVPTLEFCSWSNYRLGEASSSIIDTV